MNKSLQYLLVVFVFLLLLFFINQNQQNKYKISSELIFHVNEDEIHRILLEEAGDSLVLVKSDTSWFMPQADTLEMKDRQINQFFEKVINGSYDMIMSKNPNKWSKFGVTDSSGKKITLFSEENEILSSVIFSNKGQDYSHNFYRTIGANEVYRTTENVFYMINSKPTYWGSKPSPKEPDNPNLAPPSLNLDTNE
jgi:hypothetical protein